jgi:hypothetical protein
VKGPEVWEIRVKGPPIEGFPIDLERSSWPECAE